MLIPIIVYITCYVFILRRLKQQNRTVPRKTATFSTLATVKVKVTDINDADSRPTKAVGKEEQGMLLYIKLEFL
jgi:hypothetical protein